MTTQKRFQVSENIQSAYDKQYEAGETFNAWRQLNARDKAQHIVSLCAGLSIRTVLDIGAGEGSILAQLSDWGFGESYTALEISHSALERLRALTIPQLRDVRAFDGYELPFPDQSFDLIVLSHVLEHVEFPRVLLREMKRVGRYHAIEVPVNYKRGADSKKAVRAQLAIGHVNLYDPTLLRFFLRAEGFKIVAERVDLTSADVTAYSWFKNLGVAPTWKNRLRLRYHLWREQLGFALARGYAKESKAHSYTVLAETTDQALHIF